jgi:hypothetical protein
VTRTPDLIDALVECATPVRRLRPPLVRGALWLALAAFILALLAIGHGVRADLAERLHQPVFVVSIAAALATGALAAVAAFMVSLPDRSQWWLALPAPALAVWVGTIGYGCLTDWVNLGPEGIRFGEELRCFSVLVLTSVPLTVALTVMLRYAAMLRAGAVATTGGLAVAAITASALPLFHNHDATAMILIWNVGTALLIIGITSLFGRRFFSLLATRMPGPGT